MICSPTPDHSRLRRRKRYALAVAIASLTALPSAEADQPPPVVLRLSGNAWESEPDVNQPDALPLPIGDALPPPIDEAIQPASMWQPTPLLEPRINTLDDARSNRLTPSSATPRTTNRPGPGNLPPAPARVTFPNQDRISGGESLPLSASDVGSLLKRSGSAASTNVQARNPIVSDPHIRGSRTGALAASGSHWVPARADLDTIVSKFDSRQIESVEVYPGPYTSMLGPGFSFTDLQLLSSPRYNGGPQWHGGTDADYKVNGNQYFAQQSFLMGADDWGARFHYASRAGDDYRAGGGREPIPSSYQSEEMLYAFGRDYGNQSIEFGGLWLNQTDVVFPGYVFDIDDLLTDGYTVRHRYRDAGNWDEVFTEAWYNRTEFNGNAQNPAKRRYFPLLDLISYTGFTDVDSMSTGYRQGFALGSLESDGYRWIVGHDLRFIKQELNEISSGVSFGLPLPFTDRNSPIPRSYTANPGLFTEYQEEFNDQLTLRAGARADYATSDIVDDPAKLEEVGLGILPASYSNIVGTDHYDRDFGLLSGFLSLQNQWTDSVTTSMSAGYAERNPTLTELYAAQPFLLVMQNGLNNLTGDPELAKERLFQFDIGIEYQSELFRTGWRGFHSWALDYITYENTRVLYAPPVGDVGQVSLRYVNTDLATFLGTEWFGEWLPNSPITPFASLRVVDGRDRTRNGDFATSNGNAFVASEKVSGLPRGAFSGITGSESEPLPGIPPLEGRIGWRIHDTSPDRRWNIEVAGRLVNQQTRIATSLLETATPGFAVWDTRSVFRVPRAPGMVVALGVENMFDRRYREHFDFRNQSGLSIFQPGANFYVSTSWTY